MIPPAFLFFSGLIWRLWVFCDSIQTLGMFYLCETCWWYFRDGLKCADCFGYYRHFKHVFTSKPWTWKFFPFLCVLFHFLHKFSKYTSYTSLVRLISMYLRKYRWGKCQWNRFDFFFWVGGEWARCVVLRRALVMMSLGCFFYKWEITDPENNIALYVKWELNKYLGTK